MSYVLNIHELIGACHDQGLGELADKFEEGVLKGMDILAKRLAQQLECDSDQPTNTEDFYVGFYALPGLEHREAPRILRILDESGDWGRDGRP